MIDGLRTPVTVAVSTSLTVTPVGGVPLAVTVLTMLPPSRSACVVEYVAVHVVDAPGASVATGHAMTDRPGSGSVTPTEVRVTLPALVTRNEYATVVPAAAKVVGTAVLATVIAGLRAMVTVAVSASVTVGPAGGVPAAVATLTIEPASMSACVTVYVAVHVVAAAGASTATGQVTGDRPGSGSVTATELSVTLPALVTANEYVTTSPTAAAGVAVLASEIAGCSSTVTVAESVSVTGRAERRGARSRWPC